MCKRTLTLTSVVFRDETTGYGEGAQKLDGSSSEDFGVVSVPTVEGHLGTALDGNLFVSVDEAGPVVVVEEEYGHLLVDEGAFWYSQVVVAVVSIAMRDGRLEDTRNRDFEFAVPGQRWIAQLLVDAFGNVNLDEEANATDGPALIELFLGSSVYELLAFLLS